MTCVMIHGSRGCHNERELGTTTSTTAVYSVGVLCGTDTFGLCSLSSSGVSYCVAQTQSTVGTMTLYMVHHHVNNGIHCALRATVYPCCCGVCTTYEMSSSRHMEYDCVRIHVSVWMSPLGTLSYTTTTITITIRPPTSFQDMEVWILTLTIYDLWIMTMSCSQVLRCCWSLY